MSIRVLKIVVLILALQTAIVNAQKVSVGNYEVKSGSTFIVPIFASDISDIAGIDIALSYEPSVVRVQSYQVGKILSDCFKFDNIDNSKGSAKVIIVCTDGINAESLVIINFTLKAVGAPGSETELKLSVNFSDTKFKLVIPETEDGHVKIRGEVTSGEGGTGVVSGSSPPTSAGNSGSAEQSTTLEQSENNLENKSKVANEAGEAFKVKKTVTPAETKPEVQPPPVNISETQGPYKQTPEKAERIETPEVAPTKTQSEVKAGSSEPFRIPGFTTFLSLLVAIFVSRWRK